MSQPQSKKKAAAPAASQDTPDLIRSPATDKLIPLAPPVAENQTGSISAFTGEYAWLDNAYPSPVELHGYVYPSVVNAYHAARMPRDKRHRFILLSPAEAAAEGLKLAEKPEFKRLQVPIMRMLIKSKFALGTDLAVKLMSTDDLEIVYDNQAGDRFWGVAGGWGKNLSGLLLMLRRANLRIEILSATAPTAGVGIDPTRTTDPQADVPTSPFLMAQPASIVH